MTIFYLATGVNHLLRPETFIKIMPSWIPFPETMVLISGICEILFAILLVFRKTRRLGAWLIIGLLIVVFPANIQMMLNYRSSNHPLLWLAILRLPFQGLLIWWAYGFTRPVKVSDNPKGATSSVIGLPTNKN